MALAGYWEAIRRGVAALVDVLQLAATALLPTRCRAAELATFVVGSGNALHPTFALWRLAAGRDAVAVKRRLDVLYGKKDRATDAAETDNAGGLPRRQRAPRNPDDACRFPSGRRYKRGSGCRHVLVA